MTQTYFLHNEPVAGHLRLILGKEKKKNRRWWLPRTGNFYKKRGNKEVKMMTMKWMRRSIRRKKESDNKGKHSAGRKRKENLDKKISDKLIKIKKQV